MQQSEYLNIYQSEAKHFFYVGNHEAILNFIERSRQKKEPLIILDAGCGTGHLAKKLSKFGRVTGVDYNPLAVKLSRKRGVNTLQASVTRLPFRARSFDLLVCVDVLYHTKVKNDRKALSEFFRVLAPSGLLILKVPAYDWLRGKHDIVVQTRHRYTKSEIKDKLQEANFQILKLSYFASFLLPLAIFKRLADRLDRSTPHSDVKLPPKWLNIFLIWLFRAEVFLLRFIDLPFGLSVLAVAKRP